MPRVPRPNKPLGSVNVLDTKTMEVEVCVFARPQSLLQDESVEVKAVLALDGSNSMIRNYGDELWGEPNLVQRVARKVGGILANVWSSTYTVEMIYWAVGPGGQEIQQIGEFDENGCQDAQVSGPQGGRWGRGTKLLPPVRHIVEDVAGISGRVAKNVPRTMGIIITDGVIEDEKESMDYCYALGEKLVASGLEDRIKLGLLGVGSDVDRDQIERFDDMFEETALAEKIDLWTGGVATDWREEHHILGFLFGELFDEDTLVLNGSCNLTDAAGVSIPLASGRSLADGLPGKFRFKLPAGARAFTLKTPAWEVTQDLSEALV